MTVKDFIDPKAELKLIYAVYKGAEERNPGKPTWFYTDKELAYKVAEGRGWWGGRALVEAQLGIIKGNSCLTINGLNKKIVELNITPEDEEKIKSQALKKLSPLEKEILGL